MLLLPLILWGIMLWFDRWQTQREKRPEKRLPVHKGWLLVLAYIGCLSHPLFDWFNSYGIRLLEPFSSQWFYGDTLFIIDIWLWAALIAGDIGAVAEFCETPPEPSFAPHRAAIDRCFGAGSIPAIMMALEAEGSDWAREQIGVLRHASPTSLFVTHELLSRGAKCDLAGCLAMELALTRVVVHDHPDFCEGVRAVLVDKDHHPKWQPASIEAVDAAAIERMFGG
mgnify:CR=1 FL=1